MPEAVTPLQDAMLAQVLELVASPAVECKLLSTSHGDKLMVTISLVGLSDDTIVDIRRAINQARQDDHQDPLASAPSPQPTR